MKIYTVVICIILLSSCVSFNKPLTNSEAQIISDHGVNQKKINEMIYSEGNENIDSLLIYKNGELIFERYFNGYNRNAKHDIRSSTKAITALLVGIAIDKGFIPNVYVPIVTYFPEKENLSSLFSQISIFDLLTMRSGLNSDDWYAKSPGNEELMYKEASWVDFFFNLESIDSPGKTFRYSTAGVIILGEIIARASKISFERFADLYLFKELDITDYSFAKTPAGEIDSGGHLKIKPIDFAKIGLLVLQNGIWQSRQIISSQWISQINNPITKIFDTSVAGPYMGYLWWQEPVINGVVTSFQSRGNGGQYLIGIPRMNLLGVFTGSAYNSEKQNQPFVLMKDYIIPAFQE